MCMTWRSITWCSRAERGVAAQLDQLERGDDRRERVAQLVAEHREELVLGAVRVLRREPRRALLLGSLAIGEIARDLREADQLAVASRIAVITTLAQNCVPSLRNAPALVLEAADARRDLELELALAGAHFVLE